MVHNWDVKVQAKEDKFRARQLAVDLGVITGSILNFAPHNVDFRHLRRNRIRIFSFSRAEEGNEYFIKKGRKRYVCLNANILKRNYWAALQLLIHGIAHSFCYLRDDVGEEAFCEWVSYSVIKEYAEEKGEKFARMILKSIMRQSSPAYRSFYRAAKRLEEKRPNYLVALNNRARHRKIRKSIEKQIISRALKTKRHRQLRELDDSIPELEKGFRKVR